MFFSDLVSGLGAQDSAVHLGPSVLYDRFRYYRHTAASVFIAEPDPMRAASIYQRLDGIGRITLLQCAILGDGRKADLRRYNFDAVTSFQNLDALRSLFPGLRETAHIVVDVLPVSQLLKRLRPQHRGGDLLVIDCLGEAQNILKKIDDENALSRFQRIVVRTVHDTNADADGPGALTKWLAERHYNDPFLLDGSDANLPVLYFHRNQLSENLAHQTDLVRSLRAEKETQRALLDDAKNNAKKADADMRVAMRLHIAAQDDLKDLQSQYASLFAAKEEQDKLLRQVARKLSYASEHLHRLAVESPEIAGLLGEIKLEENAQDEFAAQQPHRKADRADSSNKEENS